jgi:hypothetical protein
VRQLRRRQQPVRAGGQAAADDPDSWQRPPVQCSKYRVDSHSSGSGHRVRHVVTVAGGVAVQNQRARCRQPAAAAAATDSYGAPGLGCYTRILSLPGRLQRGPMWGTGNVQRAIKLRRSGGDACGPVLRRLRFLPGNVRGKAVHADRTHVHRWQAQPSTGEAVLCQRGRASVHSRGAGVRLPNGPRHQTGIGPSVQNSVDRLWA